jgi:transposase
MGKIATLKLLPLDRFSLQRIIDRGENWRERERSRTLILLDDGLTMKEVSEMIGIDIRTVGLTRMDWLARGFVSLTDLPRSGAPKKILPAQLEKLVKFATEEPLTAKALLGKHIAGGGEAVHVNTITKAMKAADFVWKRTRSSLKKKETNLPSKQPKVK